MYAMAKFGTEMLLVRVGQFFPPCGIKPEKTVLGKIGFFHPK